MLPEKVSQIFPLLLEEGDIEHLFSSLLRPKPSPRATPDAMDLDAPVSKEPASAQYPVITKLARTEAYNTLLEAHIADWEEEGANCLWRWCAFPGLFWGGMWDSKLVISSCDCVVSGWI